MKRISFLVALFSVLVLSFGLSYAQNAISVDDVVGKYDVNTVKTGADITFKLRYVNATGANVNISNGYEIYSPDGATWSGPVAGDTLVGAIPRSNWDLNFAMNVFIGTSRDTVGIIGAKISGLGMPNNFNGVPYGVKIGQFDAAENGLNVCIDSAWFRPGGTWKWAATGINAFPAWGGPYCYDIYDVPNEPPQFTNCPVTISGSHCTTLTFTFEGEDPTPPPDGPDAIIYSLISGPGSINSATGVWSWNGATLADVGTSITLVVGIADAFGEGNPCTVNIEVTNEAPTLVCPADALISTGGHFEEAAVGADACNDPLTYSIVSVTPPMVGTIAIDPVTGVITADPITDPNNYLVVVQVTDGNLSTTCEFYLNVIVGCPYGLQIAKEHNVIQGGYWTVPVTLLRGNPDEGFGGFNVLIAYDNSALSFQNATLGAAFGPAGCGWEYFTYRYGADGNCTGGCPSGLIRVVGMAETNNGPNHPACFLPVTPAVLFNLNFLVSNDRTLECQYVPIRFFWLDCTDNTISNTDGDELYISCSVADFENTLVNIANPLVGFPTYLGAQDVCVTDPGPGKTPPIRAIDFINGGIDIVCADSIDARGDINLNGLSNEIADAVNFTNYFIKGLAAFTVNVNGQIAATDVNADGIVLSVADLVYLIRVIVGDAQPYAKIAPVASTFTVDNGVVSVDGSMGAAFIVAEGNVTPTLLANNMKMDYAFDGTNTKILVYPPFEGVNVTESFTGAFVTVPGNVVSIELATADGNMVVAKELPSNFGLNQNYPNPFNPTTTVSFSLPVASNWTLKVYNVIGQEVATFAGAAEAGVVNQTIDASNLSSGVYFYTLNAGNFSATKKMMLVK